MLNSLAGQYATFPSVRNAFIASPRIGLAISANPTGSIRVAYEGLISPIYYLAMAQNASYDFLPSTYSNSVNRWSTPYLDQSLTLDLWNAVRLVAEHEYQHLDFQTMDWNSTGSALIGVDDAQDITVLSFGIEAIVSNFIGSRLNGGLFWEQDLTRSSHWGTVTSNSKFLFRLGIEG